MNCGRYKSSAKKPVPSSGITEQQITNWRLWSSSGGSSASSPMCRSMNGKLAISTTNGTSSTITRVSPKPQSPTWSSATSSAVSPSDRVVIPQ